MDTQEPNSEIISRLPGPMSLLGRALSLYRSRFQDFLPISILLFLALFLQSLVSVSMPLLNIFTALLSMIVTYLSYAALIFLFDHENPGSEQTMTFYHKAWNIFIPYIWVTLLVGVATVGGLALLIVPGIIVSVYLSVSVFVVALEGLGGVRALTQSYRYVKGYWWAVFLRLLIAVLAIVVIVTVLSLVLLPFAGHSIVLIAGNVILEAFIIIPLVTAYLYGLYQVLLERKAGPVIEGDVIKVQQSLTTIVIVGAIVFVVWIILLTLFSSQLSRIFGSAYPTSTPSALIGK